MNQSFNQTSIIDVRFADLKPPSQKSTSLSTDIPTTCTTLQQNVDTSALKQTVNQVDPRKLEEKTNEDEKNIKLLAQLAQEAKKVEKEKAELEEQRLQRQRQFEQATVQLEQERIAAEKGKQELERLIQLQEAEKQRLEATRVQLEQLSRENAKAVCRQFKYEELKIATSNWSKMNMLGTGGFGDVFRGEIHGTVIAVKKLSADSKQGISEFEREIQVLSRNQHPNIVRLLGSSYDGDAPCIVYPLLPKGSLLDMLKPTSNTILTPCQRLSIAAGTACGLCFLHAGDPAILHLDVKVKFYTWMRRRLRN